LSYQPDLVTKFRTAVFDEHIASRLVRFIVGAGRKRGFAIDTMSLMPDHIHLVMESRPDFSIAECALSIVNNTHHWMQKRTGASLSRPGVGMYGGLLSMQALFGEYSTAQIRRFLGSRLKLHGLKPMVISGASRNVRLKLKLHR